MKERERERERKKKKMAKNRILTSIHLDFEVYLWLKKNNIVMTDIVNKLLRKMMDSKPATDIEEINIKLRDLMAQKEQIMESITALQVEKAAYEDKVNKEIQQEIKDINKMGDALKRSGILEEGL